MSPTISTKKGKEPKRAAVKSRMAMEREKVILLGVIIACAATLVIHLLIQVVSVFQLGGSLNRDLQAQKSARLLLVQEDDNKFAQELELAKRSQGENLAGKHREEEFEKRQALDPAFAESDMGKAMLQMKAGGCGEEDREAGLPSRLRDRGLPGQEGAQGGDRVPLPGDCQRAQGV
jgi:hypothetical protein